LVLPYETNPLAEFKKIKLFIHHEGHEEHEGGHVTVFMSFVLFMVIMKSHCKIANAALSGRI
jgi:hypothetical protein